jgi:hypothetical protein
LCHTSNLRESYDRYPISLSIDELARSFHLTKGEWLLILPVMYKPRTAISKTNG